MPKAQTLQNLPHNILSKIANSLNSKSMKHLSETSKQMRNAVNPSLDSRLALRTQLNIAVRSSRTQRVNVIKSAIFFARTLFEDQLKRSVEPIDHTVDVGSYRISFKMEFRLNQHTILCFIKITHKNKCSPLKMVLSYGMNYLELEKLQGNENWVDDAMEVIYATRNASERNKRRPSSWWKSPLFMHAHPDYFVTKTNGKTKTISYSFGNA